MVNYFWLTMNLPMSDVYGENETELEGIIIVYLIQERSHPKYGNNIFVVKLVVKKLINITSCFYFAVLMFVNKMF